MSVIVAGWVHVAPVARDRCIEGLRVVVERAREYPGCLDVSISPDPVDPGRVNIFEHFESEDALEAWRAVAPAPTASVEIGEDRVLKHDVTNTRPPFG